MTQIHPGLTRNGTEGRTYGGDPGLVHIPDHHRRTVGSIVADHLDATMRLHSVQDEDTRVDAPLCPACYMIALADAAVWLARRNGQSIKELGETLSEAFAKIAEAGSLSDALIEDLYVTSGPTDHRWQADDKATFTDTDRDGWGVDVPVTIVRRLRADERGENPQVRVRRADGAEKDAYLFEIGPAKERSVRNVADYAEVGERAS